MWKGKQWNKVPPTTRLLAACALTACLCLLSPIVCFLTAWNLCLSVLSGSLCWKSLPPPTACSFCLVQATARCPAYLSPVCASGFWFSSLRFEWAASPALTTPWSLISLWCAHTLALLPYSTWVTTSSSLIFLFNTSSWLPGYRFNGLFKTAHALI